VNASGHKETSLEKGLHTLLVLSKAGDGMTVSELSTALGYPESTMVRLLQTLKRAGYVWQGQRRGPYKAGYRVLELAGNLLDGMELRRRARSALHELASRLRMVAYLKVKSGAEAVTVDVAVPPKASRLSDEIGQRLPMHICSPGKAILAARGDEEVWAYIDKFGLKPVTSHTITDPAAFIDEMRLTRARGYAVNREESGSIHSIAAPVMQFDGKAIAAVAVSFSPDLDILGTERERAIADEVIEIAHLISFSIGYRADQWV
jgi:DNA-binding IclR family transcriptional regulator